MPAYTTEHLRELGDDIDRAEIERRIESDRQSRVSGRGGKPHSGIHVCRKESPCMKSVQLQPVALNGFPVKVFACERMVFVTELDIELSAGPTSAGAKVDVKREMCDKQQMHELREGDLLDVLPSGLISRQLPTVYFTLFFHGVAFKRNHAAPHIYHIRHSDVAHNHAYSELGQLPHERKKADDEHEEEEEEKQPGPVRFSVEAGRITISVPSSKGGGSSSTSQQSAQNAAATPDAALSVVLSLSTWRAYLVWTECANGAGHCRQIEVLHADSNLQRTMSAWAVSFSAAGYEIEEFERRWQQCTALYTAWDAPPALATRDGSSVETMDGGGVAPGGHAAVEPALASSFGDSNQQSAPKFLSPSPLPRTMPTATASRWTWPSTSSSFSVDDHSGAILGQENVLAGHIGHDSKGSYRLHYDWTERDIVAQRYDPLEDAQRLFGRVFTAVQKIVKRNTNLRGIVSQQRSTPHHSTAESAFLLRVSCLSVANPSVLLRGCVCVCVRYVHSGVVSAAVHRRLQRLLVRPQHHSRAAVSWLRHSHCLAAGCDCSRPLPAEQQRLGRQCRQRRPVRLVHPQRDARPRADHQHPLRRQRGGRVAAHGAKAGENASDQHTHSVACRVSGSRYTRAG